MVTKKFRIGAPGATLHKFACRQCCRDANHKIIASYIEDGSEELGNGHTFDWNTVSQIIQCAGCEEVSFRTSSSNSEDYDYDDDGAMVHSETEKYYPGRSTGLKGIEGHFVPYRVNQIYKETRSAIENDLSIIGGIGVRALLDAICKEVEASGKDLFQQIDDLHAKSLVTKEGASALHKLRLLGNKSAHEAEAHSREQLSLALEVVEYILVGTYVMPQKVERTFVEPKPSPFLLPPVLPSE